MEETGAPRRGGVDVRAAVSAHGSSTCAPFAPNEGALQEWLAAQLRAAGCEVWREVRFLQPSTMTAGKSAQRSMDVVAWVPRPIISGAACEHIKSGVLVAIAVKLEDDCKSYQCAVAQATSAMAGYDWRKPGVVVFSGRPWRCAVFSSAQASPAVSGAPVVVHNDETGRTFDRERALMRLGSSMLWHSVGPGAAADGSILPWFRMLVHMNGQQMSFIFGRGYTAGPFDG